MISSNMLKAARSEGVHHFVDVKNLTEFKNAKNLIYLLQMMGDKKKIMIRMICKNRTDIQEIYDFQRNIKSKMGIQFKMSKFCFSCYKKIQKTNYCSRCRCASYCDRKCQKSHWKKHKKFCIKRKKGDKATD